MVDRVFRTGILHLAGKVISLASIAVMPALFIKQYGVAQYADWITLTAGVSWISTLDLGLQTYIANEMTIAYAQGNKQQVKTLQSVGLRVSLAILGIGAIAIIVFTSFFPIHTLLPLSLNQDEASMTFLVLSLQVLVALVWGQINSNHRVVGRPDREALWGNVHTVLMFLGTGVLVLVRVSFTQLALFQLCSFFVVLSLTISDMAKRSPEVLPNLRSWNWAMAKSSAVPSLWFGSFLLSGFLAYQAPILILSRLAGPSAVVSYSLSRTYYGIVRQVVTPIRHSLRPEITRLFGARETVTIQHVFRLFQKMSMTWVVIGTTVSLLLAPKLVPAWTRSKDIYDSMLYLFMAITTVLVVAKDTTMELPYATNRHIPAAKRTLGGYLVFAVLLPLVVERFGASGAAILWGCSEAVQILLIQRSNAAAGLSFEFISLVRMIIFSILLISIIAAIVQGAVSLALPWYLGASFAISILVGFVTIQRVGLLPDAKGLTRAVLDGGRERIRLAWGNARRN
jgi:O-antigen/teichoic acid export membrane protein